MRVGIVNQETWGFFCEIYESIKSHHQTNVYTPRMIKSPIMQERISRYLFKKDFRTFLNNQDVVFFEWASELLAKASHLPKTVPIITRLHRYEMYHWVHKINWDHVDKIILVSEAKRQEFLSLFPRQEDKTIVIPEAVSLDRFRSHIKPYNKDLGTLCHLTPRKRVYELILAYYELLQEDESYRLHIGGGMHERFLDYYFALQSLVKKLALSDKVIFYGSVNDSTHWYRNVDIFISNSYSEGLQVSPLEAIASGCYCLCHSWGGAEEFFPEENIYHTDSQLIGKVKSYSSLNPDQRFERISNLQNIIKSNFTLEKTNKQILDLIDAVGHQKSVG